ncbi:hypothetical protein [Geobacter sp.]|uniref:hypothetical protein n=1 Tax=Geobacter sp. TaxID=46610 RepID=UPI0027B8A521|nr:hypothetical protein [Geobacter sp.]
MKICNKNIRATALQEFWGDDYRESVYLWEGAKHKLTLSEMDQLTDDTLRDLFAGPDEIVSAGEYCKDVYHRILPKLTDTLNRISEVRLPEFFWRTAFGYWLFRHICITYEKYAYLSEIDVDRTSVKLLSKEAFYVPYDHVDYLYCFCNDFGVQQLVSQYYYLFARKEFASLALPFSFTRGTGTLDRFKDIARKTIKFPGKLLRNLATNGTPNVVLCGVFCTPEVYSASVSQSQGKVSSLVPPPVKTDRFVDEALRAKLLGIEHQDDFEYFLVQTLYYCLPQRFVERFRGSYDRYLKDIKGRTFTHIVSENWISDISSSLYVATAQNEGRTFVSHEHGSGMVFDRTFPNWIDMEAADRYLTVGWSIDNSKVIPGGFICRDTKTYEPKPAKKGILYIARTNFPYLMEFSIYNVPNTKSVNALKRIRRVFELLPASLSGHFVFRPRKEELLLDTEHALETASNNITVDRGDFSQSIANARIVIVDHLSTGSAEIVLRKIPCLLIQDQEPIPAILEEMNEIFEQLKICGVMHDSAESAVSHLTVIYDNVAEWWNSEAVQAAVNRLVSATLAPPQKTIDYLVSCRTL